MDGMTGTGHKKPSDVAVAVASNKPTTASTGALTGNIIMVDCEDNTRDNRKGKGEEREIKMKLSHSLRTRTHRQKEHRHAKS